MVPFVVHCQCLLLGLLGRETGGKKEGRERRGKGEAAKNNTTNVRLSFVVCRLYFLLAVPLCPETERDLGAGGERDGPEARR